MNYKTDIKESLKKASQHINLTKDDVSDIFSAFFNDELSDDELKLFLTALYQKGETSQELSGAITSIKERAKIIDLGDDVFDCCGTGGDGMHSYNISTTVALLLAAAGIKVAKHGNRASSSQCGSADVLEEMGVSISANEIKQKEALDKANLCFLLAPLYHSALAKARPIRKSLSHRTIFNLIGPMANPAQAKNQMIGVFSKKWLHPLCDALIDLGHKKITIVHSEDGFDEISIFAPTNLVYYDGKAKHEIKIHPEDFGIVDYDPDMIKGGDAPTNAKALLELLENKKTPSLNAYRDMVCLNAAFPLFMMDKVKTPLDGYNLAQELIATGQVLNTFKTFKDSLS